MSDRFKAHLAIITANVLFALNYSYSKSVIDVMTPDALIVSRIGSAAVVFTLVALTVFRQKVEWRDVLMLALASLLGIGGNQYIFLHGLEFTSPVDAAILATLGPVLVLLISAVLGRDRITLLKSVGITMGASGALTVVLYGGLNNFGSGHLLGNLLILCSVFSYACYLIVVKQLMAKYSPYVVMAWVFGLSALIMVPLMIDDVVAVNWGALDGGAIAAFVFVIVGATWLAYICVASSLKKLSPTTASIYSYSQPVLASFFAILRGQDEVSWVKIVAAILVFAGVYIVTLGYKQAPRINS